MNNAWDKVCKILAAIAGGIAGAFGGWDTMLSVLVAVMAVDYASGWIVAILGRSVKTANGHLDSNVAFHGLLKKGLCLLVVLLGALLDKAVGQAVFRNMAVWFYIANEGLSILENLALAGVPFPQGVKRALEQIRAKNEAEQPQPEPKPPDLEDNWPDEE